MDEKTQGLVLKLIDYKDADKLASIFTFDHGIITAKFVGVRREKAKLKAMAQPFTFADFNFTTRAGNKVVSGANMIDNFYHLMMDYNKTICGYIVLDIIKSLLPENKPEQDLFVLSVSSLKKIEEDNEFVATIDFMLKFLNFSGMGIEFLEADYVYLDITTGDFLKNRVTNSVQIDKNVYKVLFEISNQHEIEIKNEHQLKQCMRLLHNIIQIRFGTEIKSFQFI